ncbi:Eaa1 [Klebsiella pneumoniae]|nr:DUF551 domain-containing protein [Klebsiella pneumoniae]STW63454.1 Eaa1 [Klebsiella pneumoniae]
MTSKLTRERIELIANFHRAMTLPPSHAEIEELARIALAAMDSEPVKRVNADQMHHVCLEANRHLDKYGAMAKEVNKLLGRIPAQPAPVVPEEWTIADAVKFCKETGRQDAGAAMDAWNACRAAMLQAKSLASINPAPAMGSLSETGEVLHTNSPVIPDGWTGNDKANAALMMLDRIETVDPVDDDRIDGIKRIVREFAATTQLPGSDPATVPGKWIPVSERMPEDRTQVILWDAEIGEVTSGHYSHKTQTFYHCGDAIENEITHWMPPPCAQQEVK